MADKRLFEIVKLLLEQTEARKVQWEKSATKGAFLTSFAKYSVVMAGTSQMPHLFLYDEDGDVVEDLALADTFTNGDVKEALERLYILARRRALGTDEALDDILKSLRTGRT